jgi:hypothetical protein
MYRSVARLQAQVVCIDRLRSILFAQPTCGGRWRGKAVGRSSWRHAALDPLVADERVLGAEKAFGRFKSREPALIEMRRVFVSAIQRILAPDLHNKDVAHMIRDGSEHRASDKALGGLLQDGNRIPTGAYRLLYDEPNQRTSSLLPAV